jgi:hypothetical protein
MLGPQIKVTLAVLVLLLMVAQVEAALEPLDQPVQRALVAQVGKAFIPALLDLTFSEAVAVAEHKEQQVVAQVAQVAAAQVEVLILPVLGVLQTQAVAVAVAVLGRLARRVAQVVLELLFSVFQAQDLPLSLVE